MQSWYNCRDIKLGDFHSPWYKLNRLEIPPVPYILNNIKKFEKKAKTSEPTRKKRLLLQLPPT